MRQDFDGEGAADNSLLLLEALRKLPEKERAIVALRVAGYTQKECGQIVGLTRAAIGGIYKRGLTALLKITGENYEAT